MLLAGSITRFVGAGVVVALQYLLPGLAAVGRPVDAALAARTPEAARGRHEHDVVVARVDDDAIDVAGGAKPHVGVGLAAVRRLVDAVTPRRALPVVRFARADPDEVGVRLRDGHVADRHQALRLELGLERRARVDGLPHAPVRGPDVEQRGVGLVHRQDRKSAPTWMPVQSAGSAVYRTDRRRGGGPARSRLAQQGLARGGHEDSQTASPSKRRLNIETASGKRDYGMRDYTAHGRPGHFGTTTLVSVVTWKRRKFR